jgi:hypothetical protein
VDDPNFITSNPSHSPRSADDGLSERVDDR